jgi:hypothetical protein
MSNEEMGGKYETNMSPGLILGRRRRRRRRRRRKKKKKKKKIKQCKLGVSFEAFTVVMFQVEVFCVVMPCSHNPEHLSWKV